MRFLLIIFILSSCYPKAFEMEEISKDVLKSKEGIQIDIKPIDKVKNKDYENSKKKAVN